VPFYQRAIGLPGAERLFAALLGSRTYLRSAAAFGSCYADLGRIDEEFRATFVEPLRTPRGFDGMKRFLSGFDYDAVDRAAEVHARIRAPVHLVWGQDDATFPVRLLAGFAPSFPTLASVKTMPGKLLVHDEHPAAYASVVRNALASVESAGIGSESAKN
jgi:pimeloyl-ACP methyl ester carboxylesterase